MSSEHNQHAPNNENLEQSQMQSGENANAAGQNQWNEAELLKTQVESESVVSFIENMVQAMGSVAAEQYGAVLPQQMKRPNEQAARRYQSKMVAAIMQKLERVEKYPDTYRQVIEDAAVSEWLERSGCKQKEYYEELECAQELTGFFGGHRQFELAAKAASRAIAITLLHRRDDGETLAELHWVLAELHAASNQMDMALEQLNKCMSLIEPGADKDHPTYKELLEQLEETRQRSCMVTA